jgi:hypothetical protein
MAANAAAGVSNRPVTGEPLYILLNLGCATVTMFKTFLRVTGHLPCHSLLAYSMSENFGFVDLENLVFPSKMRVDYVRVYQPEGWQNSEWRLRLIPLD